ncbi:sodium-dependent noradrenaline transporter-like [Amyelois transitella]|uniref:sodium-dependent noradrenaline transporter-like n=1 Tax=Amyelois transitella TaxID=680683 RepID=UPI00298FFEF3|nr:sodium-dependent noradrenaline transporter-like [Amyelois transitella]
MKAKKIPKNMDTKYEPETKCRWNSYQTYRLILWGWMMNEISTVFAPADLSHHGFYIHMVLYTISAIFVGLPLLYSEVCIAQYTNCNTFTLWNHFPVFRGVAYSSIYLIILKTMYVLILSTWYIQYAIYSAIDTPPWFTCDEFNDTYCMVKRINVSIFQHCLETQFLLDEDCGMRTASYCFFQREIGDNNTLESMSCLYAWKQLIASSAISVSLFVLSLKSDKFIQIFVKILAAYLTVTVFILLSISLSTSGSWYSARTILGVEWDNYTLSDCLRPVSLGFLSLGTGYGMVSHLSANVPFRSPAMMTVITSSLFSLCFTFVMSLIIFSGIKTMSYYHGEEENVIEFGDSPFFSPLASISEILIYFDAIQIWSFIWYLSILLCLYLVLWIQYLFLRDLLLDYVPFARRRYNLTSALVSSFISIFSWPFICSDLTSALSDVTEILQICNCLLLSISLYWIYGYKKHSVDIVFMIGIKSSYFWKICWVLNPLFITFILFAKLNHWAGGEFDDSHEFVSVSMRFDELVFFILFITHFSIIILGTLYELYSYYKHDKILNIFFPSEDWGPVDIILYRSRKMFVPEIMTTEFLYRQVRIHRYTVKNRNNNKNKSSSQITENWSLDIGQWSALTSN